MIPPGKDFPEIELDILLEGEVSKKGRKHRPKPKTEHILFSLSSAFSEFDSSPPPIALDDDGVFSPGLWESIDQAVKATIPEREGQRNRCLYQFVRRLKAFLPEPLAEGVIRELARRWYFASYMRIGTKDFRTCLADFMAGWNGTAIRHGAYFRRDRPQRPARGELPRTEGQDRKCDCQSPEGSELLPLRRRASRPGGLPLGLQEDRRGGRGVAVDGL